MSKKIDLNDLDPFEWELLRLFREKCAATRAMDRDNCDHDEFVQAQREYERKCAEVNRKQSDYYLKLMIRTPNPNVA